MVSLSTGWVCLGSLVEVAKEELVQLPFLRIFLPPICRLQVKLNKPQRQLLELAEKVVEGLMTCNQVAAGTSTSMA